MYEINQKLVDLVIKETTDEYGSDFTRMQLSLSIDSLFPFTSYTYKTEVRSKVREHLGWSDTPAKTL